MPDADVDAAPRPNCQNSRGKRSHENSRESISLPPLYDSYPDQNHQGYGEFKEQSHGIVVPEAFLTDSSKQICRVSGFVV